MIIVDSREKPRAISRILAHFDKVGEPYYISKLPIGDYQEYGNGMIVVDRKQNIAELAKNCTADHERFRRELMRARDFGVTLVVLVEQPRYKDRDNWVTVGSVDDLLLWSGEHTTIRGEQIYRILRSWMAKYPLEVEFCDKRSTGRRIIEILRRGGDE